MKVELILPRKESNKIVELGYYIAPQTLIQLAAVTPPGIDITITDENCHDIDFDSGADLVGISVMTSQFQRAKYISDEFRKRGATVVWGGIHPTAVDQSDNKSIDSYVVGEAELVWPRLLDDFKKGKLEKRYQSTGPVDLNSIPLPRRDLTDHRSGITIDSIISSRGCKYDCEFCSASVVYGRKTRGFDAKSVEEDIANIQSNIVAFYDENFLNDKKYASRIIEIMGKSGKKYFVQLDPKSALDEEVAEMLGKAGVRMVLIGFESVNSENFSDNPKYVLPKYWKRIVGNLHKYGVVINANLIAGFDNDGPDVFDKMAREAKKADMDFFSVGPLTPYPGTRLYNRLISEGRIIDHRWENYDLKHVVFQPRLMTPEELIEGVMYLRSNDNIFRHLKDIFND